LKACGEKACGVERQQHRDRAAADAGKNLRRHRIQLHQRRRRARIGWPDPALARKREGGSDRRLGADLGSQRIEHGAPFDAHGRNCRRLEFLGGETGVAGDERKQASQQARAEREQQAAGRFNAQLCSPPKPCPLAA
jgi:hypothetical protein